MTEAKTAGLPTAASEVSAYVMATGDCRPEHIAQVGGKAVGLGRLMGAGQRVPASFVVTAAAYAEYLAALDADLNGGLPEHVRREVEDAYRALCETRGGGDVVVAVRSSATVEDSTDASCAGQFRTFLGARGVDQVVAEVEACFRSAFAPHVNSYRATRQLDADDSGVAVVVQELVDARVAGVMFTQHPRTGDPSLVVIESSYGLGEAVVGGAVVPDLFTVNKITKGVQERVVGSKTHEHRLAEDARRVELCSVEEERRAVCSVNDEEIGLLLAMAAQLEKALGRGLDVEWAIGGLAGGGSSEELFALQVRPITVAGINGKPSTEAAANPIDAVLGRLSGRGALG